MRIFSLSAARVLAAVSIALSSAGVAEGTEEEKISELGVEEKAISKGALELLYAEKFEELDKLAVKYSNSSERVPGGVWKLRHFSNGLCYPKDPKDGEEWNRLLSKLEKWNEKSGTAFSLNALGHGQLERGWNVRGHSFAGKVKPENWGTFSEWVEKATVNLEKAVKKDPGCIDAYKSLLHVGISQGWPKDKMQAMFERAIKVAPEYYDYYYNMAFYKMERWHGKKGEWQEFLNTIPNLVPGEQGQAIYTRTALQLFGYYLDDFFGSGDDKVHWDTMKQGFEVMMKEYPNLFFRNKYAMLALTAQDGETAKRILLTLEEKEQFFEEAWGDAANLELAKKWLAQLQVECVVPESTEGPPLR